MERLILISEQNKALGVQEKVRAHLGRGVRHRALSVLVFNSTGELLLQKRSAQKMLWPGFWSNTCCSHPRPGESTKLAAERRLREELGISLSVTFVYSFRYRARYLNVGSENEYCSVFIGRYDGVVTPDPREVAEIRWVSIQKLKEEISQNSGLFTPWFKQELVELEARRFKVVQT